MEAEIHEKCKSWAIRIASDFAHQMLVGLQRLCESEVV